MAISNAIRRCLQEYIPGLLVKWPNDLVVPGFGKIGGILIENLVGSSGWDYAVVGIGININQNQFASPQATSLSLITGNSFPLEELFKLILEHLILISIHQKLFLSIISQLPFKKDVY
jgi:BirA family biotin operon repressor/biotin-[acetyl-CoA-carboxylase] ligase